MRYFSRHVPYRYAPQNMPCVINIGIGLASKSDRQTPAQNIQ